MPEGDTVWRTARRLHEALAGHEIVESDLRWPGIATARPPAAAGRSMWSAAASTCSIGSRAA